jgi:hypothetical protein
VHSLHPAGYFAPLIESSASNVQLLSQTGKQENQGGRMKAS